MNRQRIPVVVAIAAATIAASDISKFYQSVPHRTPDAPTKVEPEFRLGTRTADEEVKAMQTNGYEPIGYSAFNGKEANRRSITKHGMKVGADKIVYIAKYVETQNTGAIGNTSWSSIGAFTYVAPMSVRRYDQVALFFRKAPRKGIGIYPRPLTDEEKVQLGTNKGVVVLSVVNGSPAFAADVLPGDIVTLLGGRPVYDPDSMRSALEAAAGVPATLTLHRGGEKIEKEVTVPVGEW